MCFEIFWVRYVLSKPKKWIGPLLPMAMSSIQLMKASASLSTFAGGQLLEFHIDQIDKYLRKIGHNSVGGYQEMEKVIRSMYSRQEKTSASDQVTVLFSILDLIYTQSYF